MPTDPQCDNCRKGHCWVDGQHVGCAGTVTIFDQDGPGNVVCGCWYARQELRKREADRKLKQALSDYERDWGAGALTDCPPHPDD